MKMAKDKKKKAIDAEINRALLDDFDKFGGLIHRRWKEMIYCAVAILVVFGIVLYVWDYNQKQIQAANAVLANADTEEALVAAIGKYGKYDAANFARERLASVYIAKKEYAKALTLLTEIVENTKSKELKARTQINIGYLYEEDGKIAEAIAAFQQVGDNVDNSAAVRAEAYYSVGRLSLMQGNKEQAVICFTQVKTLADSSEGNTFATLATALLSEIN